MKEQKNLAEKQYSTGSGASGKGNYSYPESFKPRSVASSTLSSHYHVETHGSRVKNKIATCPKNVRVRFFESDGNYLKGKVARRNLRETRRGGQPPVIKEVVEPGINFQDVFLKKDLSLGGKCQEQMTALTRNANGEFIQHNFDGLTRMNEGRVTISPNDL